MRVTESERKLRGLLRTMRRPRGEAQWTQMISAAATADPLFAGRLAALLVESAPRRAARDRMPPLPPRMTCTPEVMLADSAGRDLGRIDLRFADETGERFELLVEVKLGAAYGDRQLERYLSALDASSVPSGALIAVTTVSQQTGEEGAAEDQRWLGSIRWADIFEALRRLEHGYPLVAGAWRAALDLLREQGDFGPMDLDEDAVHGWARRDEAETILRYLLTEVAQPALDEVQRALGSPGDDSAATLIKRGQSAVVWPWRNQMHLKYAVPGDAGEERLRLQFLAARGRPHFTVKARYEHPKEDLSGLPDVALVRETLGGSFRAGNDGYGHYWAHVSGAEEWLHGSSTLTDLLEIARNGIQQLAGSGIFEILARLTPATPASPRRADDDP